MSVLIDVATVVLFLIVIGTSIALAVRRGLFATILHIAGLLVATVAAVVLTPPVMKLFEGSLAKARPDFLQEIYDYTNGTFIECNTAYLSGGRHTTELHENVLKVNGWRNNSRRTVIMDEDPSQDFNLSIPNHYNISNNTVGGHIKDFNSILVLAHFKGHAMGGFGGALKQLSIGFASRAGKANIHSGGFTSNYTETWSHKAIEYILNITIDKNGDSLTCPACI